MASKLKESLSRDDSVHGEEVEETIKRARAASATVAKAWMKMGRSVWIERSLEEGWSYTLEDIQRSRAHAIWLRTGSVPNVAALNDVTISSYDHQYWKQYGRKHLERDRQEIEDARNAGRTIRDVTGDRS